MHPPHHARGATCSTQVPMLMGRPIGGWLMCTLRCVDRIVHMSAGGRTTRPNLSATSTERTRASARRSGGTTIGSTSSRGRGPPCCWTTGSASLARVAGRRLHGAEEAHGADGSLQCGTHTHTDGREIKTREIWEICNLTRGSGRTLNCLNGVRAP